MGYYLRKHWKENTLAILLQIALSGAIVLQSLAQIQMLDSVIQLDMSSFAYWMVALLLLCAAQCLLTGVGGWVMNLAVRRMNNSVRADIVASILRKNHKEFHAQQSGEYLSWFTNDVKQIQGMAWSSFYSMVSLISQIVFSVVALAMMHWSLLAASLLAAVLIINAPKVFGNKLQTLAETCATEQALATSKLKDLLMGFDVLRFFGRTERFVNGNQEASDQLEYSNYKLSTVQGFMIQGITLVSVLCQALVLGLIGFLSIKGLIVQSAILGGGNLCGKVYNGLGNIGQARVALLSCKPYFDKITVHADEDMGRQEREMAPLHKAISVEHLGFRYGEKPILMDTNMRFEKGGKYALTGPSGCGKSTLLKLLLGWLPEYTGKITFDGQNAKNFTSEQLQQQMSYIEQDVFLFNTTIRDNITLGENYSDAMIARAIKGSALDHDLANMPLGLDTPVGEDGSNLSGGQKQRVAIARALLHNRSILLVDEGTSALDQKNADIVEQSLLNNPDLTLILISHHLSEERKKQFTKVYEMEPIAYAGTAS